MHRGQVPVVQRRGGTRFKFTGRVYGKREDKTRVHSPDALQSCGGTAAGNEWIYEVKWGGRRSIVVKDGSQVRVFAENGHLLDYPEIEKTVREASPESVVIDGEIIGLTRDGKQCEPQPDCHLKLYAFDLLHINGRDLTGEPIERRKGKLCTTTIDSDLLFSPSLECEPGLLVEEVRRLSLQGVVAKRRGSLYEPGECSGAWANLPLRKPPGRKRAR